MESGVKRTPGRKKGGNVVLREKEVRLPQKKKKKERGGSCSVSWWRGKVKEGSADAPDREETGGL